MLAGAGLGGPDRRFPVFAGEMGGPGALEMVLYLGS